MPRQRAIAQIPIDLAARIDQIAGPGHRSEYIVEILERELRRRSLLEILRNREPIWKNEDHPELANGAEAWIRQLRQESEARFQREFANREKP